MAAEFKPCTQKQRRYMLAIWHKIKLSDDVESMWKNIKDIIKKDPKNFWNEEKQKYELNRLSSKEVSRIIQGFLAQQGQNLKRGINVFIKTRDEFGKPCIYCKTPIYWGVASMNERIPIEIIDGKNVWHDCPKAPKSKNK